MQSIRLFAAWRLVLPLFTIGPETAGASLPATALPFQESGALAPGAGARVVSLSRPLHRTTTGLRYPAAGKHYAGTLKSRLTDPLVLVDSLGQTWLVRLGAALLDTFRQSGNDASLAASYFCLIPVELAADPAYGDKTPTGRQQLWWAYFLVLLLSGLIMLAAGRPGRLVAAPALAPVYALETPAEAALCETATQSALSDTDRELIQKVQHIVAAHYSDEHFALPVLCQKMSMSRSQLFRKMQKAGEAAPSDFIRNYRLQQAAVLLETTTHNVSEIAWQVGYKDLAHFSKSFQEKYGSAPTEMRKKYRSSSDDSRSSDE